MDCSATSNNSDLTKGEVLEISESNGKQIVTIAIPKEDAAGLWEKTLISTFGEDWLVCALWLENENKIVGLYWDKDDYDNMFVLNSDGTEKTVIKRGEQMSLGCPRGWLK